MMLATFYYALGSNNRQHIIFILYLCFSTLTVAISFSEPKQMSGELMS